MATTPSILHPSFRSIIIFHKRPIVRLYETLSLMLLTTAFFTFVFIRPTAAKILNLIETIRTEQGLNQTLQQKTESLNVARNTFSNLATQLTILDETLPKTPSTANFLATVESIAQTRQLKLKSVAFDQYDLFGNTSAGQNDPKITAGATQVGSYSFTIIITGPYSNLQGFIEDLASLRRIVSPTSFLFSRTTAEIETALTLNISGTIASAQMSQSGTP